MKSFTFQTNFTFNFYRLLAIVAFALFVYLYMQGFELKAQSFGLGLGYVLMAVLCLGISIFMGFLSYMESTSVKLKLQYENE